MRLGSLSQKCFESNTKCGRCDKKGRCNIAAPFGTGGRFGMAAAYRVAAPSIRSVPWAARASCWPLPQQLLPASATGGGRRRCALDIFSGRMIYNFAFGTTAFAERSVAMKAPVGLLSGRAVCASRWRGFAPTSSAERSKRIFTSGCVYPLYLLCARLSLPSMMSFAAASRSG